MTLRQYLAVHPDYRTVTREPRRCAVLVRADDGGTELRPVRIVEDVRAQLEAETREGYLVVEASTHSLGEQAPYFSLTATLYRSKRGARAQSDSSTIAGGCMHDEILASFPNLAPIEALHLADVVTGEPMHAGANGWYFYRQGDEQAAARALRVHVDELPVADNDEDVSGWVDEDTFMAFVETLRPRWAEEAKNGLALLMDLAGPSLPAPSPDGSLFEGRA